MAKTIMIQGTMSSAGKSFLAAALCRIFRQDGYSCAPFKSQNMALNSYVTADGLEIGRAQAMQAEAAMTEPSVDMNPILLKPTSDSGSQVIVNGKVRGDMRAAEYFRHKKELVPEILAAYRRLADRYDIIVVEGAGSPVELNLKKDDIVNMGLAKMLHAPVLLAGDIDRGGVFAQLLGTLALLEEDERALVKGLIVNKFRGDRRLFDDGVKILEARGGKPVAGVIPYIDCDLEDEDSLAERLERKTADGMIDIAVIRLPHISNFTDFDVFARFPGVSVRFAARAEQLGTPDMVILPGTKSTIADLKHIRENGLEAAVKRLAADGMPVFGICGGYQMLGESISDPDGAEGGGNIAGMGLLGDRTVFAKEKTRRRTEGNFAEVGGVFAGLSGKHFSGYEIHMGSTVSEEIPLVFCRKAVHEGEAAMNCIGIQENEPTECFRDNDGAVRGNVYGCYIHGIFDSGEIAEEIVKVLYERKGLSYSGGRRDGGHDSKCEQSVTGALPAWKYKQSVTGALPAWKYDGAAYKQRQFDLLADGVRQNLDMDLVYQILERGCGER